MESGKPSPIEQTIVEERRIWKDRCLTLDHVSRRGKTPDEIAKSFDQDSSIYDEMYSCLKHKAHSYVVKGAGDFFPIDARPSTYSLDVAAGTGLVGEELLTLGFRHMDGIDPSEGMRQQAMRKGVYTNYFLQYMDGHRIDNIPTDTYDCITMSGGMNIGLTPCIAFLEMCRIVRPGGLICFNLYPPFLTSVAEYEDRLRPLFSMMEADGVWTVLDEIYYEDMWELSKPGIVFRFVVNTSDVDPGKYRELLKDGKKL